MSSLVTNTLKYDLSHERLDLILQEFKAKLTGRVQAAYIFGSASEKKITKDSDIDLILIQDKVSSPFGHRPLAFADLFEIFPRLDILVYSQRELDEQLADSEIGFWKSVRLSMKRIL